MRARCSADYAAAPSTDADARRAILTRLLGSVGDDVWIEPPFFCDYGVHVHIGPATFVNANCVFLDSAEIRIGANVLIAPAVQLLTATHPLRAADRIVPPAERSDGRSPYRTHAQADHDRRRRVDRRGDDRVPRRDDRRRLHDRGREPGDERHPAALARVRATVPRAADALIDAGAADVTRVV